MKNLLFSIITLLIFVSMSNIEAKAETQQQNDVFVEVVKEKATKEKQEPKKTKYKYQDRKGQKHDIYITKRGACFYYKTSKNNKEYRVYLDSTTTSRINAMLNEE